MKKFLTLLVLTVLVFSVFANIKDVWADKILYMIMIDRFNDGDPSNNKLGPNGIEYDPKDGAKYSGGDIAGIIQKLDYIKGLGVDGIWVTPPVANQWWDPWVNYGGYHGYWARNLKKIDEHFGTNDLYAELGKLLNEKGMALIQDIVVNHVGNYFRFKNGNFELNLGSIPTSAPTQEPFNLNNYNDPIQRERAIYHWTPDINNYLDPEQKLFYQMSGLDDLNTENPEVIDALKDSYKHWIKLAGLGGFRVDTAMFVPKEFFKEFYLGKDGIYSVADPNKFINFGEVWLTSKPYEDTAEKEIESYFDYGFNAMLDFPLLEELRRVIKGGQPTDYLAYRLERRNQTLEKGLLVTFIDNHDMERFAKGLTPHIVKQALAFLFSIPGVPVIYYGTEQMFEETRQSMFANGWGSGGKDHFDTESDMYNFIKELVEFRKANYATTHGKVKVLASEKRSSGVLVYLLQSDKQTLLVSMNTSNEEKITSVKTDFEPGTVLKSIYAINSGIGYDLSIREDKTVVLRLPARSFSIHEVTSERAEIQKTTLTFSLNIKDGEKIKEKFKVEGRTNANRVYVYLDKRVENEMKIDIKDGKFEFEIDPTKLDPGVHTLLVRCIGKTLKEVLYTPEIEFYVDLEKEVLFEGSDPLDDDSGPKYTYVYPTDATFKRQMDIVAAKVEKLGPTLIISVKPRDLTKSWGPLNGFDHVTYQIFIDAPAKKGTGILPLQNYSFDNWDWDYELFVTGWSSAIYTSKGASKDKFGEQIGSPEVFVEDGWVKIIVKGDWLGNPASFEGWTIYITSWDYDGIESKFRPLQQEPKAYIFGGGEPTDPFIMDDMWIEF